MSKNSKKGRALAIVGMCILVGTAGFVGWLWGNDWMFSSKPKQITPDMDGVINKREWARASYSIPFYLDVDNTIDTTVGKANVDGWNYMHVAEDDNYYYIGLDLCSDRTDNTNGEWISFQLANRLPDTGGSKLAFYALEDYGYEYLFYNVSDDSVFEYTYSPGTPGTMDYYDIPLFPEADYMEVFRGGMDGDFEDFWADYDDENFTITSSYYDQVPALWLDGDFVAIHFGVNITEKLPDEEISSFLASMTDMDLNLRLKSNLTANIANNLGRAETFFFAVAEHGPMPGNMSEIGFLNSYNEILLAADSITSSTADLDHFSINATTGMFYFSLYGWNDFNATDPTSFEVQIDKMSIKFTTERMNSIIGNSISPGNYEIAYSYGSSDKCSEDHRMFEFKMAKSEFPPSQEDILYVCVAGYGTMAIVNTNYWVYPTYGYPLPPIFTSVDDFQDFLPLDMSIT